MNRSTPILICDENEDVRLLIKEMLIKHGFFHLLEAHSREEILQLHSENQFFLIHNSLLSEKISKLLLKSERFLVIAQDDKEETIKLSATFGVKHLISFPYSSKSLVDKINSLLGY